MAVVMPFLRIIQRWSGRDQAPRAGADHLSTSYRNLLRTPGLPSLFGSISLMKFGGGVIQLTLILYVLQTWESSELAGAVVLVSWLPGIVVSPVAGVLMDRVRDRCAGTGRASRALVAPDTRGVGIGHDPVR